MTHIVLYFNGRCGSTWLMDYLYVNMLNHGIELQCLWEYWAENRTYHISESKIEPRSIHDWEWTAENINQDQQFEDKAHLLNANPGTKMIRFTEHNGYVDKPFDYMLSNNNMKWITMVRKDRFNQMISHAMCWITNQWHAWDQQQLDEYRRLYETNPISVPKEMCENWLRSYLRFVQRRRRLQESGLLLGQVTYEKINQDAIIVAKDLLTHFGVTDQNILDPSDLTGSTLKLGTTEDKKRWVANYDELLDWYNSSEWPAMVG